MNPRDIEDQQWLKYSGVYYSRENAVCRNVYVCTMNTILAARQLEDFCVWKFGPVEICRVYPAGSDRSAYGYVVFYDPKHATAMIDGSPYTYLHSKFRAVASFPWLQPDTGSLRAHLTHFYRTAGRNDSLHFLSTMRHLTLPEKLHFVHRRPTCLVELPELVRCKVLKISQITGLSLWQLHDFFYFLGRKIEEIISEEGQRSFFETLLYFIGLNCPNLTCLIVYKAFLQNTLHRMMPCDFPKLRILNLTECGLTDADVKIFCDRTNLKYLNLQNNTLITAKYLNRLPDLQQVYLMGCGMVKHEHLIDALRNWKDLRELNITGCHRVSGEVYTILFDYNICLQVLRTDLTYPTIKHVLGLKNLEELTIHASNGMPKLEKKFFQFLVAQRSNTLKHFTCCEPHFLNRDVAGFPNHMITLQTLVVNQNDGIDDVALLKMRDLLRLQILRIQNCNNFHSDFLLRLIRNLRSLQLLDIRGCDQICCRFYSDLSVHLSQQMLNMQRNQKLIILVRSYTYKRLNLKYMECSLTRNVLNIMVLDKHINCQCQMNLQENHKISNQSEDEENIKKRVINVHEL